MKITFKGLGFELTVDCNDGATCNDAIEVFERTSGKIIKGMDLYADGVKLTNLDGTAPSEITAVKSKHESAANIKFKGLGFELEVECEDGASCDDAIEAFERTTGKIIKGMDLYANGSKVTDLSAEAPLEITAVKSKHESAASITFKGLGFELTVDCEDGASCEDAIEVFERTSGKIIKGMDLYAGGAKLTDLTSEAPVEITAVKSKHESAGKITFKGLGFELTVDCEDGASCDDAIEVFERTSGKIIKGMDLYAGGTKVVDTSVEAPSEITAVKSKHESAK